MLQKKYLFFPTGIASMTVPVYIAEVSPPHLRGQLVTINSLFITGGQFIASVVDGAFSYLSHNGWRYLTRNVAFCLWSFLFSSVLLQLPPDRSQVHAGSVRPACRAAVLRLCLPAGEPPLAPAERPESGGPPSPGPDPGGPECRGGVWHHQDQHRRGGERYGIRSERCVQLKAPVALYAAL